MLPLKVVFDTNVYLMAVGSGGGYIDYWLDLATPPDNRFLLYTSQAILTEVQTKLETRFELERTLAVKYVEQIKNIATVVNPRQKINVIERDPDDNIILECAQEARADIIVSADKDLIKLKTFEGVQIHHPTNLRYMFNYLDTNSPD